MTVMADEMTSKRLRRAVMAGACGLLLGFSGVVSAYAADDADEDTFEQRIIKNILGGLGVDVGRPGIEYRERSPLVLPPSRDLPPPAASNEAVRNPAWPREQQKKVVARTKANVRAGPDDPGSSAAMTPDELRQGTIRKGRITDPSQTGSVEEPNIGRPMSPAELNTSSIFTWNSLFGTKTETAPFSGEPTRSTLTEPPPGYQTPSANAPYGTVVDTPAGWKVPTILDRPVGSSDN